MLKRISLGLVSACLTLNLTITTNIYAAQPVIPTKTTSSIIKMTPQEIDKEITNIKNMLKGIKIVNAIIPTIMIGSSAAMILGVVGGSIVLGALTVAAPEVFAPLGITLGGTSIALLAGIGGTSAKITQIAIVSFLVVAIPSAIASIAPAAAGAGLFGLLSTTSVLTALIAAKKLEEQEKAYPGSLTEQQRITMEQFKNSAKTPITRGVVQGIRLEAVSVEIVKNAMEQYKEILSAFGGDSKKAKKNIASYLKHSWQRNNYQIALNNYEQKKTGFIKTQKANKPLSPAWTKASADLLALNLNPSYLTTKAKLKSAQKTIEKLEKQYPMFQQKLGVFVQDYIKKAQTIVAELLKPV